MRCVYKYAIHPNGPVTMPRGAELMHVDAQEGPQGEHMYVWALVDTEAAPVHRLLHIYGTGANLSPDKARFVGTVLFRKQALVFHIFDHGEVEIEPPEN